MLRRTPMLVALLATVATAPAWSQQSAYDPVQARYLAANCFNCHGTDGAAQPGMKALAGYDRKEMITAMNEFQSGKKPATLMHQISKGYTEQQIAVLADFFSRQPKAASK